MYSLSVRFNAIFFTMVFALAGLCALNHLSAKVTQVREADVYFNVTRLPKFYVNPRVGWEEAGFLFDLRANLSKIYNWNTKQLFLYITVNFTTEDGIPTETTVYDEILPRNVSNPTQNHFISRKNQKIEYPIRDLYRSLRNQTVGINVWIEIMPIVGYIERVKLATIPYKMPPNYTK